MARKTRVEYPGAVYHVRNRGDRREAIFRDDFDHRKSFTTRRDPFARRTQSRIARRVINGQAGAR
jgi:hypothetical protein